MNFRTVVLALALSSATAFTVRPGMPGTTTAVSTTRIQGYLDDLSSDLYAPDATPDIVAESKAATDMSKERIDRFGPGDFSEFVDFDEFDGGDGRTSIKYCRIQRFLIFWNTCV